MNDNSKNSAGIVGLDTVVLIIFIVLKLCKLITWSWFWVLSPLWIPLALVILVFISATIVAIVSWIRNR